MNIELNDQSLIKSLETSGMDRGRVNRLRKLVPSLDDEDRRKLAEMIGRSKGLRKKESAVNAEMADLNEEFRGKLSETGHRLAKEIRVQGEAVEKNATQDEVSQLEEEIKGL